MNTEDTVYDSNEKTQFDKTMSSDKQKETQTKEKETPQTKTKGGMWKKVAVSGGVGILFGAASTLFTGAANPDEAVAPHTTPPSPTPEPEPTPIVDENISMATCVDDDMSFSQAFAAARAEVGPGGVFEWHGNLYNTYTAEEWDNMTAEEQEDYNEHFAWTANSASADDSSEITGTVETGQAQYTSHTQPEDEVQAYATDESMGGGQDDEVEVLGVVHDDDYEANIGVVSVEGQDVVLIDVDEDQVFDFMATDTNSDGEITDDEIIDITDQNLTVDDLGGFTGPDPNANLYASTDEPDYINYNDNNVYEG